MRGDTRMLLATGGRPLASWQGRIDMPLTSQSTMVAVYGYSTADRIGTVTPLLQTVVGMQIYTVLLAVDPDNLLLMAAYLVFADPDGNPKVFPGLKTLTLFSTTGGEPFVINDIQNHFHPNPGEFEYDIYSWELATWGYQNLTAGLSLNFQLKLEWIE